MVIGNDCICISNIKIQLPDNRTHDGALNNYNFDITYSDIFSIYTLDLSCFTGFLLPLM